MMKHILSKISRSYSRNLIAHSDIDGLYDILKERLTFNLVEIPFTEDFDEMIRVIFQPDDIPIVAAVKLSPTPLEHVAKVTGLSEEEVFERGEDMSERGILVDLEIDGETYYVFPEYYMGWAQMSWIYFCKHRSCGDDSPMDFRDFMKLSHRFIQMDFYENYTNGEVMNMRAAPQIDNDNDSPDHIVADFETSKGIIENLDSQITVTECICKNIYKYGYNGEGLDESLPLDVCMSFTNNPQPGRTILTKEECIELLEQLNELGHVHAFENIENPSYMCNCHPDTCQLLVGMREHKHEFTIVPSRFEPFVDTPTCIGCGVCVERCPLDLISIREFNELGDGKKVIKKFAVVDDPYKCIGCGLCETGCPNDAITMERRKGEEPRIYLDETELLVNLAFERNKLNEIFFNDPNKLTHQFWRKLFGYIEDNPLSEHLKSLENTKSKFLKKVVEKVREENLK